MCVSVRRTKGGGMAFYGSGWEETGLATACNSNRRRRGDGWPHGGMTQSSNRASDGDGERYCAKGKGKPYEQEDCDLRKTPYC